MQSDEPRPLTRSEIDYIVSDLPRAPAVSDVIRRDLSDTLADTFRRQLSEIKLRPSKVEDMKAIVFTRCRRALGRPGEMIGMVAAVALGQPITQATLNTFHSAGAAGVGVSTAAMFSEILNLSSKRRVTIAHIQLAGKVCDMVQAGGVPAAISVARAFTSHPIKSLMETAPEYVNVPDEGGPPVPEWYSYFPRIEKCGEATFMRLRFSVTRLYAARITTADIAAALMRSVDVNAVYSPTSLGTIDVYVKSDIFENTRSKIVQILTDSTREEEPAPLPFGGGAKAKAVKFMCDKLERLEEDCEMSVAGATASMLFFQTVLEPKLDSPDTVVSSSTASRALIRALADSDGNMPVVHPSVSTVAFYRSVVPSVTRIVTLVRGVTNRAGPHGGWFSAWLDLPTLTIKGVPLDAVVKMLNSAMGGLDEYEVDGDSIHFRVDRLCGRPPAEVYNMLTAYSYGGDDDADGGKFEEPRDSQWISLIGNGLIPSFSNVMQKLCMHPAVNHRSTYINSPKEIVETRGIEAARASIMRELHDAIVNTGSSVLPQHLETIVGVMTASGSLMPFTARGSTRQQQFGAYADSSFEHALQAFKRAAVNGESDSVTATSTSILVGTLPAFGTGSFQIVADGADSGGGDLDDDTRGPTIGDNSSPGRWQTDGAKSGAGCAMSVEYVPPGGELEDGGSSVEQRRNTSPPPRRPTTALPDILDIFRDLAFPPGGPASYASMRDAPTLA